jgi:hypothetical protein
MSLVLCTLPTLSGSVLEKRLVAIFRWKQDRDSLLLLGLLVRVCMCDWTSDTAIVQNTVKSQWLQNSTFWIFNLSWSPISLPLIWPSVKVSVKWDETTRLLRQLPPLFCYCADNSQPIKLCHSLSKVDCLSALWNETLLQSFNVFCVPLPIFFLRMLHTDLPAVACTVGCLNPAVQGIQSHPTHLKCEIWQKIVVANRAKILSYLHLVTDQPINISQWTLYKIRTAWFLKNYTLYFHY